MAARFESLSFVFSNVFSMAKYGYHTPPKTNGWNPKNGDLEDGCPLQLGDF